MNENIVTHTVSALWMGVAGFSLRYSELWDVGVKIGAVVTFFLASIHMILKIYGQVLDNKLKEEELND